MKIGTKLLCSGSNSLDFKFKSGKYYEIIEIAAIDYNTSIVMINKNWFSTNPKSEIYLFDFFYTEEQEIKLIRKQKLNIIKDASNL